MDEPSKTVELREPGGRLLVRDRGPCHSRPNLTHGVKIFNIHVGCGSGKPKALLHSSFSSFDRLLLLACAGRRNKVKNKNKKALSVKNAFSSALR